MNNFVIAARAICYHGKIALKGFVRMIFGAGTACLLALAVYGLVMVSSESGWAAVCDFVASVATAVVGLACMYIQGGRCKRTKGGYER